MRQSGIISIVGALLLVGGCGGGDQGDDSQVRKVVERFSSALERDDFATACSEITPALEHELLLEVIGIHIECRGYDGPGPVAQVRQRALAGAFGPVDSVYRGLTVADVAVDGDTARATFEHSQATVELVSEDGTWKVSEFTR